MGQGMLSSPQHGLLLGCWKDCGAVTTLLHMTWELPPQLLQHRSANVTLPAALLLC